MLKIALFITKKSSWLDQEVVNPKTNNKVKVRSLPPKERDKYRPKSGLVPYNHKNKQHKEVYDLLNKKDNALLQHPLATKLDLGGGQTPLHHAALAGMKEVLNHPEVATLKNNYGQTALHNLATKGVKEIVNHPAAVDKDEYGNTPAKVGIEYEYIFL